MRVLDRRDGARAVRVGAILALDATAALLALRIAVELRFGPQVPQQYASAMPVAAGLLLLARVPANAALRLHAWSFRMASLPDAVRVGLAGLVGSALFVPLLPLAVPGGLPRSVYALEFFLATSAFGALRFGPRVVFRWQGERARHRAGAARTLIVGVNPAAELLARDILRSPQRRYDLVGFVGGDPEQTGRRLDGKPILGVLRDLPAIIGRERVTMVLLALPRNPASRIREILDTCGSCRVHFKITSAFTPGEERPSVNALDDVAPEDLLPRDAVVFDQAEIGALVRGRRALVTGAGGSIGGETCRQLVRYGVKQLVMVDMNENELYLLARRLAEESPGTDIRPEVADIREPGRLLRIGSRFRPHDVFHAAAHKHVPLMEEAPEEAAKNNVFGTLHVARMAEACGAERFVLISTDKAVKPTSVMGASKRVAEIAVRDLARTSRTRMTAVRFGNVLGSAGSVVPIFKRQIERGGPVTVTHPDCTRYFMTISEAVGLVLVAGLGAYGDLCVLDMGEPIRIAELARIMINLAGGVPGEDIPIVFTGLRPGEKLCEEVLTDEEEQTHAVRDRIRIATSPPPPPDLHARLEELQDCADRGDGEGVVRVLRKLVPTYRAPAVAAVATVAAAARDRPPEGRPRDVRPRVATGADLHAGGGIVAG